MRKHIWIYCLLVAVLLAACGQGQQTTSPQTGATTQPGGSQPQAGEGAAATLPAVATQDPNATAMACSVVSQEPTPGATEASMFPPIGNQDWVLGSNPEATMTIIEYSDFM